MARLIPVEWPDRGSSPDLPSIPLEELTARLARTRAAMDAAGLTHLVVYGDKEHFANLAWLTHFDPRFEEALFLLGPEGKPRLLVGNECAAYVRISPLLGAGELEAERYQPFSLPDQPRGDSRDLIEIFQDAGISSGARVGLAGWKEYGDPSRLDAPAYLADALRDLAGRENVRNAAGLLARLRRRCTAWEIAFFEATNARAGGAMRRIIHGARPGMTDREVIALASYDGLPLSCHMTCKTGPKRVSLASASGAILERGQPWSANVAYWGANVCRAAWVAESSAELPAAARDYVDAFGGPYMDAVAAWVDALRIGVEGGTLQDLADRMLPAERYNVFLNPGHLIHYEEWLGSPVYPGSKELIEDGMLFQTDIIPSHPVYFTARMEEALAIAGPELRAELAARFPAAWERIRARWTFAREILGFPLHEEHLPLSDTFGLAAPFLLNPQMVFAIP